MLAPSSLPYGILSWKILKINTNYIYIQNLLGIFINKMKLICMTIKYNKIFQILYNSLQGKKAKSLDYHHGDYIGDVFLYNTNHFLTDWKYNRIFKWYRSPLLFLPFSILSLAYDNVLLSFSWYHNKKANLFISWKIICLLVYPGSTWFQ